MAMCVLLSLSPLHCSVQKAGCFRSSRLALEGLALPGRSLGLSPCWKAAKLKTGDSRGWRRWQTHLEVKAAEHIAFSSDLFVSGKAARQFCPFGGDVFP